MRKQSSRGSRLARVPLSIFVCVVMTASAGAETISLEWRPAAQTVVVGSKVSIGLYAVSDDPNDAPISVMDVVLQWDPTFLDLTGNNNNGPYTWLSSGFPTSGDSGLNTTFADGDAFYNAQSQLGNPAAATPDGLLVTTLEFDALNTTTATILAIPETLNGADTIVIDGIPGLDVHGMLGSATVRIVTPVPCDFDLDGDVDVFDFNIFTQCFGGAANPPAATCPAGIDADLDGDGDVDVSDFILLAQKFTGSL